ncbi:MAG: 2-oxoglutarate dehydrogenase complex dihydrolipoyllysine-residue succinyltransferase [Vulcanimicrobiota bacterium]
MAIELKVPSAGESISNVVIAEWLVQPGGWIAQDKTVVILETDKVNLEVPAPVGGKLVKALKSVGDSAEIGETIALIEEGDAPEGAPEQEGPAEKSTEKPAETKPQPAAEKPGSKADAPPSPAAQRVLAQSGVSASEVSGSGKDGRILKEDVQRHLARSGGGSRAEEVVSMSPLRKKIAERLVSAQQTAAILTTFNEVDMTAVMELRSQYKDTFQDRYGIKLGFMGFFIKAAIEALKAFPAINAEIREDKIVYKDYYDIGVAVGGGKGLVVPVIRNAERMGFAQLEETLRDLATRAQKMKLTMDELEGGTFTISNGGVYGSMLSTPILNPPQSGILGLHNIVERPMAVQGKVEIRPVMYLALSYDHRIVDGREAVSFLVRIKECIESPARMLLEV